MTTDPDSSPRAGVARPSAGLLVAGVVIGVWAVLPPFVGPGFTTAGLDVEIVDHPVPALVLLGATAWSARARGAAAPGLFVAGLVITLAGIWMTAAHAPLVLQAVRGGVGWAPTVHHTLPGLATLGLGAVWARRWW